MVKIDLITGFLGSGKTTFIKKYGQYLLDQGKRLGILENDFGAVNVDMMLLQDMMGDNCELEMVSSGFDADCHRRRFKTKLISMGLLGYDRVLVEPSGIYDVDEFFDVLCEEPLDRWYEIGNVITIVDATLEEELSEEAEYLLASQLAQAGCVILSKLEEIDEVQKEALIRHLNRIMEKYKCERRFDQALTERGLFTLEKEDFDKVVVAGHTSFSHTKLWFDKEEVFQSVYVMNKQMPKEKLREVVATIMKDGACGKVFRIKGFMQVDEGKWIELNATHTNITIQPIEKGQDVLIFIGENLNEEKINSYLNEAV